MTLQDLDLKNEYRSDRDDIVSEFFVPCLSNCIQYDRCIEYVSLKSLTSLCLGFDNFTSQGAKMRIVCGHRFNAYDLEFISKMFAEDKHLHLNVNRIRDKKIKMVEDLVTNGQIKVKIAIPHSEDVVGSFSERVGIFTDATGDIVAFTGTSNQTFDAQNRSFESVDVFTSWNDQSRIETKINDFERLWKNQTKYVDIYDFAKAKKDNILKYSSAWALDES